LVKGFDLLFLFLFLFFSFLFRAEEAVDTIIDFHPTLSKEKSRFKENSVTLNLHYIGYQGFSSNLAIRLIQGYGISPAVANRLVKAYGGRAHDVLQIAREEQHAAQQQEKEKDYVLVGGSSGPSNKSIVRKREDKTKVEEILLIKGFPFLEAEVIFATRFDWVCHAEDFLAHRTRLAFVNRNAAISAIPRVVELMGNELGWDSEMKAKERKRCLEFMHQFGGATPLPTTTVKADTPDELPMRIRMGTHDDLLDAFTELDKENHGFLVPDQIMLFSELLNYRITPEEAEDCIAQCAEPSSAGTGEKKIAFEPLFGWWNSERLNPGLKEMRENKMAKPSDTPGSGTMFG
jgi:hypothetical protein